MVLGQDLDEKRAKFKVELESLFESIIIKYRHERGKPLVTDRLFSIYKYMISPLTLPG